MTALMRRKRITLGSNSYVAKGDDARRQLAAQDSWRTLPDVDLVDLQFAHRPEVLELSGFRCVPKLRYDSGRLTGAEGRRKPIVSEMFDLLAREALAAGNDLFMFSNSDVLLTPETIAAVHAAAEDGCQAQVFSRMDFDGKTGADIAMVYQGQDAFAVDALWWMENRWRFRPYIIGETSWDNVYTAILVCHARTRLHNRTTLARHEEHEVVWYDSPFRAHNLLLLTLDSFYHGDWCRFCDALRVLRPGDLAADETQEEALRRASFRLRPDWRTRLVHVGRVVRAFMREWLARARRGKFGVPPYRSEYEPPSEKRKESPVARRLSQQS